MNSEFKGFGMERSGPSIWYYLSTCLVGLRRNTTNLSQQPVFRPRLELRPSRTANHSVATFEYNKRWLCKVNGETSLQVNCRDILRQRLTAIEPDAPGPSTCATVLTPR
jgi:hypothetical protein